MAIAPVSTSQLPSPRPARRSRITATRAGHLRIVARHRLRVVRLLPLRLARGDHRKAVLRRRERDEPRSSSRSSRSPPASPSGPFGAIIFGRLGDLVGRKYTFLVTIVIMGLVDALVGLLPTYASIGVAAPIILIALRLLQGLALGGEYGGAATYVAEHAPPGKRGFYTSWIQTTATVGLFLSLLVILGCRCAGRGVRDLGLAHPVPPVDHPARDLRLHPAAAARVAGVQADEGGGQGLEGAVHRVVPPLGQPEARAARAVRRDAGPGGGLVHGHVLRAVLPHPDAEGRPDGREPDGRRRLILATPFFIVFGALSDRIGRK